MELVRKNIHMNRQKGKAVSQITLDDDYNIPDQMPDAGMLIQEKGTIEIAEVKVEAGRVRVKGNLQFWALYMGDSLDNSLHSIQGQIPFEEMMNVEDAKDGDSLQLKWMLEDVSAFLINSRKLSIKTVLTLELAVEELFDEEVPVSAEGSEDVQIKTSPVSTRGSHTSLTGFNPTLEKRKVWPSDGPQVAEGRNRWVTCSHADRPLCNRVVKWREEAEKTGFALILCCAAHQGERQ